MRSAGCEVEWYREQALRLYEMYGSIFMHTPVQRKCAADAAHGRRGEQGGEEFPCSMEHARTEETCHRSGASAVRRSGKKSFPLLDHAEVHKEIQNSHIIRKGQINHGNPL